MKSKTKFGERYAIRVRSQDMDIIEIQICDLITGEVQMLKWHFKDFKVEAVNSASVEINKEGE